MKQLLSALLLLVLAAAPAHAQIILRTEAPSELSLGSDAAVQPERVHLTQLLTNSASGQASLQRYHELKALGKSPLASKRGSEAAGSRQGFLVYNYTTSDYDQIEFTLMVEADRFNIWVEDAEMSNGRITTQKLEALRVALEDQTPAESFDPARGVLALDEHVFGNPTDVDLSGKTDVLVLDIRDGYSGPGSTAVQGFVDPGNLSGFNVRDILHLDTHPSLDPGQDPNGLYLTAAHEYQHLIRFAYDPGELTFVDEGLSEWAEVVTGFGPRTNNYWSRPAELRRPLLGWRGSLEPGVDFDYQRAGLLTNYIAERIGVLETGAITRSGASGAAGYASILSDHGLDLVSVLTDFHLTNTINDASVDARYTQGTWFPTVDAEPFQEYDGSTVSSTSIMADGQGSNPSPLEPGSVVYYRWTDVRDFDFSVDALPGSGSLQTMRDRIRVFLVLSTPGSAKSVVPIDVIDDPFTFAGDYTEITAVITHVNPALPGGFNSSWAPYRFSADWTQGNASTATVAYDDGNIVVIDGNVVDAWPFSGSVLGVDAEAANRFERPDGATLTSVEIATYYEEYFSQDVSGPRDYTLKFYSQSVDGDQPGELVFALEREDMSTLLAPPELGFDTVDLTPFAADLAPLTSTFYVAQTNAGTDLNNIVIPLSQWAGAPEDNPSFFYVQFSNSGWSWANFANITVSDAPRFEDRVAPIRVTFSLSTAGEAEVDLPEDWTLEQNYPNPFNPQTAIAFRVPNTGHVRLAVYDILGREVQVLIDDVRQTGRHEVRFDASELASGLYIYALDTPTGRIARSMMLLR